MGKYEEYPNDLKEQREQLRMKNNMLSMSTTEKIRAACRSHDLEVVDMCITFCQQQNVDASLDTMVEKLHSHRTRLVEVSHLPDLSIAGMFYRCAHNH